MDDKIMTVAKINWTVATIATASSTSSKASQFLLQMLPTKMVLLSRVLFGCLIVNAFQHIHGGAIYDPEESGVVTPVTFEQVDPTTSLPRCAYQPRGLPIIERICPKGYSIHNDTHCQECFQGSAIPYENRCRGCKQCQRCPSYFNMQIAIECSPMQPQVCECKDGYVRDWQNSKELMCIPIRQQQSTVTEPSSTDRRTSPVQDITTGSTISSIDEEIDIKPELPDESPAYGDTPLSEQDWKFYLSIAGNVVQFTINAIVLPLAVSLWVKNRKLNNGRNELQHVVLANGRVNQQPPRHQQEPVEAPALPNAVGNAIDNSNARQIEVSEERQPMLQDGGAESGYGDSEHGNGHPQHDEGMVQADRGAQNLENPTVPQSSSSISPGHGRVSMHTDNLSTESGLADAWKKYHCYPMHPNRPTGIAYIFSDSKTRLSENDRLCLHDTLLDVNFHCTVNPAKTKKAVLDAISEMITVTFVGAHPVYCLCLAFICHGKKDGVKLEDGSYIAVSEILKKIQVKELGGIPKLVFLDTCRGDGTSIGVPVVALGPGDETSRLQSNADGFGETNDLYSGINAEIPVEADTHIFYASTEGNQSYQEEEGARSWFISAISHVFKEYSGKESLHHMMTRVSSYVAENVGNEQETGRQVKQQVTWERWTPRRNFYFPAFFRHLLPSSSQPLPHDQQALPQQQSQEETTV